MLARRISSPRAARLLGAALLLGFTASVGGTVVAQERRPADGVYTAGQAQRGKAMYLDACAQCHGDVLQGNEGMPSLDGKPFFDRFGNRPAETLFTLVHTTMPLGNPGALGAAGSADVTAFLLSQNNFPPGQNELPADANALRGIMLNRPDQPN
jgi:mono/diheme cytochrome c family protein